MPVTATLVPDRPAIRLSSSFTLKATLEGPAPLRVEVPGQVLTDESAQIWQIVPIGSAKLVDLPGVQQRWSQEYKLSPFAPGESVPLSLREFKVIGGSDVAPKAIAFPSLSIRVETSIANIKADDARPITGIEQLPPLPTHTAIPPGVIGFGVAVALLLVISLIVALRRRKPVQELSPVEWAARELTALVPSADYPVKLAAILRTFVAKQFGLPAETMTTAELAKAHPDEELQSLLEACDRAKFAGEPWTAEAAQLAAARTLVWLSDVPPRSPD